MKQIKLILVLVIIFQQIYCQTKSLVSHFTWEQDATTAIIGPNATAISNAAYISNDGNNGTFGLNAGLPKNNIDMELPGYLFDYHGIEVKIDFRRNEHHGEFIRRGQDFNFGMSNGKLYIKYRLSDGLGGYTTEVANNIYNIPNDGLFHSYRFCYMPDSGIARVWVDSILIWENITLSEQPMFWTGNNPLIIGRGMDGTGRNNAIFDNLQIFGGNMSPNALPIELQSFNVLDIGDEILIRWSTFTELNNDFFTIEKSIDAINFYAIGELKGAGTSSIKHDYEFYDDNPTDGITYYRLKQTDFDGAFSFSTLKAINRHSETVSSYSLYPNPAENYDKLTSKGLLENTIYEIYIFSSKGILIDRTQVVSNDFGEINFELKDYYQGLYYIQFIARNKQNIKAEKLFVNN